MKFKLEDKVVVIAGKDKGKTGKIIKLFKKTNKLVVEKLNLRTKHIKKTATTPGQKIQFEAPMDASNVMLVCPDTEKRTRIKYVKDNKGKKMRVSKRSGNALPDKKVSQN